MKKFNRRTFLRYFGLTSLSLFAGGAGTFFTGCNSQSNMVHRKNDIYNYDPTKIENFINPLKIPGDDGPLGIISSPANSLDIVAQTQTLEIIKDRPSNLLVYKLKENDKNYINPVIRVRQNEELKVKLNNDLDENTIIHWHGLKVDWKMDGHPAYEVKPGETYNYQFKIPNRSGTYWYHPHPHKGTAKQAYMGMASLLLVGDQDEDKLNKELGLELGKTDIPLVIQDKRFDEKGNLLYKLNNMDQVMGIVGDVILTNLTPNPYLTVEGRVYRFRMLNGSNSRIYLLAFIKNGTKIPFQVIGTDGGLLGKPFEIQEGYLSPGERMDILIDFSSFKPGEEVYLKSLKFDPMDNEDNDQMDMNKDKMGSMEGMSLINGDEFNILRLKVNLKATSPSVTMPEKLSDLGKLDITNAPIRPINLTIQNEQWLINGLKYEPNDYPIIIKKNIIEVWEIKNHKKSMPHPMHIHGVFMRVVSRSNSPEQVSRLTIDKDGRLATDQGLKDTVLVWPGETIRVAIDFNIELPGEQIYLFHCHNLEHEENGMMINLKIID